MNRRQLMRIGIGLGAAAVLLPAQARQLDIHGALAQGYVLSENNDFYGDSTSGSRDFYEVAINARTAVTPSLLASGQLTARRAGRTDDARLRVDFALLDWQFHSAGDRAAGLRIGKVKTAYGLYNDSRDVVFARPGILLPSSIYFEGTGFRDLLFSVEGAQLYGHRVSGGNAGEINLGGARQFEATEDFERSLTRGALGGRVEVDNYLWGQWLQDWFSGRLRTGLSYLDIDLEFVPESPDASFARVGLDSDSYVLSLQHLSARYSLSFEYRYTQTRFTSARGSESNSGDGAYLQYRRYAGPDWEWYLRYDTSFSDRNDRDGREAEARGEGPRHEEFTRDHVIGLQWRPAQDWGLFAEYHYVDGTGNLPNADNPDDGEAERYWQMALLMLAYRF